MLTTLTIQAKEVYATLSVYAEQTAKLAFTYNGIVKEIRVDITSVVNKGDVLATLNNDDLIASNKITQVSLKYAQLDLERYTKLKTKNLIDKSQLDKYKQAYETIKAQLELEKAILDKTILKAPFDGVIAERFIELGDVVSGQMIKVVFTMQSKSNRTLVVSFDQKYGLDVKPGDKFIYTVDGDDTKYEGSVFRIYPAANDKNRKISLQVRAKDLKVGLFGEGIIYTTDSVMKSQTTNEEQ